MNKRFITILVTLVVTVGIVLLSLGLVRKKIDSLISFPSSTAIPKASPTPAQRAVKGADQALFVPYWSLKRGESLPYYRDIVYFGLQVTEDGIDRTDDGYKKLSAFNEAAKDQNKILSIRMIDSKTNFAILKDAKAQDSIIREALQEAQAGGFSGILLNIEISALPFGSLVDQISTFNEKFASKAHASDLTYSVTAYGDTFYRVRPFDIAKLAKSVDSVYVMAYDFHKANGNPGPNFPLHGQSSYGYDFEQLISSFSQAVKPEKLVIVFGMYGYDWEVDDKGVAQGPGEPLALNDIQAKIIDHCAYLSCEWERDSTSAETKAVYHDRESSEHVVWFEDEESVKRKQDLLKSRGIGAFAYWAYSYF